LVGRDLEKLAVSSACGGVAGPQSSVTLGNSLNFVLLAASVRVGGRTLGGVDDLVGESLRHRLEGSECGFSGTLADEVDSLVDSTEGGDIDSLSTDDTTGSNTGGVFTGTGLGDSSHEHLNGVQAGEEVNEFHSLLDNPDSQLLFTVVPVSGGHDHVGQTLDDRALSLLESTLLVAASGVRNEDLLSDGLDLEVVGEGHVGAFNAFVRPFSEQFGLESEFGLAVVHDDFSCTAEEGVRF